MGLLLQGRQAHGLPPAVDGDNRGRSRFRTDALGRRSASGLLQVVSRRLRVDQSDECCGPENAFVMERPSDGGLYRAGRGLNSKNFEFPGYCVLRSELRRRVPYSVGAGPRRRGADPGGAALAARQTTSLGFFAVQLIHPERRSTSPDDLASGLRLGDQAPAASSLPRAEHGLEPRRQGHDRVAHEGSLHRARSPALSPPAHPGRRGHGRGRHGSDRALRAHGEVARSCATSASARAWRVTRSRWWSAAGSTSPPTFRCSTSPSSG